MKKEDIKIIGYDNSIGTYEIITRCSGSTDGSIKVECVDGRGKYEIVRGEEAAMRFSLIAEQLKHIQGEVLTTIEAVITDKGQLTAIKSLIKSQFGRKISWVYEQCGFPEEEQDFLGDDEE